VLNRRIKSSCGKGTGTSVYCTILNTKPTALSTGLFVNF
jgi:hypothetical protein